VEIELLYFELCPHYEIALKYLQEVIKEKELDVPVKVVKIRNDREAIENKFLGSPTIRINGRDIEPGAQEKEDFSMRCRFYLEGGEVMKFPSKNMVRRAIENAVQEDEKIIKGGVPMAIDPVCKMKVEESKAAATSEYKGNKYYFCAKGCKKAFDQNPEKYLGEEKKGKR